MASLSVQLDGKDGAVIVFNPIYPTGEGPGPGVLAFTFEVRTRDSQYRSDLVDWARHYHMSSKIAFLGLLKMEPGPPSSLMLHQFGDKEVWCCHMQVIEYV